MKKALRNFLTFLVAIIVLLYAGQYVIETGLRKSRADNYAGWNDIYQSKINAEVLINGSSRAVAMLSPRIIDSLLHVNSYNIGLNGWTFRMQYARFRIYLQHNVKPKYIIQNIDLNIFDKRKDLWNHDQFLPYFFDSIIINNTNEYQGKFTFPERYFPLFKYNNKLDVMLEGLRSFVGKGMQTADYKGYHPNDWQWDYEGYSALKKEYAAGIHESIRPGPKAQVLEYIRFCKQNNIKLIFEVAPFYHEAFLLHKNGKQVLDTIKQYAKDNDIPFLDYSNDSLSYHTKYFYNANHLNKHGAEIFCNTLANDLKAYIH